MKFNVRLLGSRPFSQELFEEMYIAEVFDLQECFWWISEASESLIAMTSILRASARKSMSEFLLRLR
jgi:hypothetical protein